MTLVQGRPLRASPQLGGYYMVDAPDRETAIVWARKIPLSPGGKVEVRAPRDHC